MAEITIYQKPTCTTCREVYAALRESGVDFRAVDYFVDPIPKEKLRELLAKMGLPASALLRQNEAVFRDLGLAERLLPEEKLLDLLVKHPELLQRPIVERGSKAILARPAHRLKELFKT